MNLDKVIAVVSLVLIVMSVYVASNGIHRLSQIDMIKAVSR